MSRSVYRYNVSLCYLYVSLTVSVVSVKRQEVTETAKSVTETSRTYRNFTMAVLYVQLPIAGLDKRYTYGSGRDMRSSNLPTTGFVAVVFIMLPITLTETQVNRADMQNITVVKNRSFMRNKGHVYGQQKYPVRNVSRNIGYIKYNQTSVIRTPIFRNHRIFRI